MEEYPRNLTEFEALFATEEACRQYLYRLRWPDGFRCPRCGGGKCWPVRVVLLQCVGCGHQTSVTAGTIFQDTRTSLKLWFYAMWWVTTQKNGAHAWLLAVPFLLVWGAAAGLENRIARGMEYHLADPDRRQQSVGWLITFGAANRSSAAQPAGGRGVSQDSSRRETSNRHHRVYQLHRDVQRSEWPRSFPGDTRSRTSCFSSLISGNLPSSCRDQIRAPSTRTSKTPPAPGTRVTPPTSCSKVDNSSCAIQAARNSHRRCVQYSISIRGRFGISILFPG